MLTIAIPTFNRNQLLKNNLAILLEQAAPFLVTGRLRMLILDNKSSTPVVETLGLLPVGVEVRRNPVNIGGNGNILRCFEQCQTPWLWVIGDDDVPEPGAVAAALDSIGRHPEAVAINHAVRNKVVRPAAFQTEGLEDCLAQLDDFGNLLFLPSTLYRVAPLQDSFDVAVHYAYSCAPHLVLLFSALARQRVTMVFVSESNIAYERPVDENRGWIVPIARGLPVLLELPFLTGCARCGLARHLRRFPTLASLVHQAILRCRFADRRIGDELCEYLAALHRFPFLRSPRRRLLGWMLLPLLMVPRLSYPMLAWAYRRLTGHTTGRNKLHVDRY